MGVSLVGSEADFSGAIAVARREMLLVGHFFEYVRDLKKMRGESCSERWELEVQYLLYCKNWGNPKTDEIRSAYRSLHGPGGGRIAGLWESKRPVAPRRRLRG